MYHNTILYCKDIDTTHVMLILNHMCYKVNADDSEGNSSLMEPDCFSCLLFCFFMSAEKGLVQLLYTYCLSYSHILIIADWWLIGVDDYKV